MYQHMCQDVVYSGQTATSVTQETVIWTGCWTTSCQNDAQEETLDWYLHLNNRTLNSLYYEYLVSVGGQKAYQSQSLILKGFN